MANCYETLLVPTDVDNEQLQKCYQQIEDSEGQWPIYPYDPMDLDYFLLAYQTLVAPDKRAAYDQEFNIVPQKASYIPCLEWTREQASETAGQGRTPGPYFAHIGIANLLNGGQVDFINGYAIRQTLDKQLVFVGPHGDSRKTKPPYCISLPGCIAEIDNQHTLMVWWKNKNRGVSPRWSYKWNADTNEWFERPLSLLQSDQVKLRQLPVNRPDISLLTADVFFGSSRCPVCRSFLRPHGFPYMCPTCDSLLRQCTYCFRLIEKEEEYQLETCPNCGR